MVQATTPTFVLTLPDEVDLSQANNIYFTLRQNGIQINKTGGQIVVDGQNVSVYLSQSETISLQVGLAQLQLNWTYANGARACSNIVSIPVTENLLKVAIA